MDGNEPVNSSRGNNIEDTSLVSFAWGAMEAQKLSALQTEQ